MWKGETMLEDMMSSAASLSPKAVHEDLSCFVGVSVSD